MRTFGRPLSFRSKRKWEKVKLGRAIRRLNLENRHKHIPESSGRNWHNVENADVRTALILQIGTQVGEGKARAGYSAAEPGEPSQAHPGVLRSKLAQRGECGRSDGPYPSDRNASGRR